MCAGAARQEMKLRLLSGAFLCVAVMSARAQFIVTPVAPSRPTPACPRSQVIESITWHWETRLRAAPGSDLWPVTWGPVDHLYAAWGDGGGFGGSDSDGRVALGFARIEGDPHGFRGININGGKNPLHPASFPEKGKTDGLLFAGGSLYASINLQDAKWQRVKHVLAWSDDQGSTWSK